MNIGIDSLAFIDDNPYERYEVSTYLPNINVYEASAAAGLPDLPEFKAAFSGEASGRRQHMMISFCKVPRSIRKIPLKNKLRRHSTRSIISCLCLFRWTSIETMRAMWGQ
jgi:hypothetical protein